MTFRRAIKLMLYFNRTIGVVSVKDENNIPRGAMSKQDYESLCGWLRYRQYNKKDKKILINRLESNDWYIE